jgi:hypothetical protein
MIKQTVLYPLLCLVLLLGGCAGLGSSSQAPPSSLGIDISISELRDDFRDYRVYYSGKRHNPSAILFVPEQSEFRLRLHWGWYRIEEPALLARLLGTIEDIYPRLHVLLTPEEGESGRRQPLAYIYTPGHASVHETEEPRTYYLRPVPMKPHPDFMLNNGNGNGP